jgi:hypothetical protein
MEYRSDRAKIKNWEETPEGFLRFAAPVARVGELQYRNADGSVRREYVSESVLKDSADSLKIKPITTPGHPPGLVDKNSVSKYLAGSTGNTVWIDSGFLWVTGTVFDGETIEAIKSGDARELSLGYVVRTSPRVDGGYDQTFRQINHLSPVTKARANGAGFKLDGEDEYVEVWELMDSIVDEGDGAKESKKVSTSAIESAKESLEQLKEKEELKSMPYKATLDGVELEFALLDEAKHVKGIEKELGKLRAAAEKADAAMEATKASLDAANAEVETLKAKLDEADKAQSDAADANLDDAKVQAVISERMKLWQEVLPFMVNADAGFEPDYSLSPIEIMTAAVKVGNPDLESHIDGLDLNDAASVGFIKGLYAAMDMGSMAKQGRTKSDADSLLSFVRNRRDAAAGGGGGGGAKVIDAARQRRDERIAKNKTFSLGDK